MYPSVIMWPRRIYTYAKTQRNIYPERWNLLCVNIKNNSAGEKNKPRHSTQNSVISTEDTQMLRQRRVLYRSMAAEPQSIKSEKLNSSPSKVHRWKEGKNHKKMANNQSI